MLLKAQVKKLRQIHAAAPIIAVDPNSPATARPRLGVSVCGVGVGLSVGNGVAVASSVRRGVALAVADGEAVGASVGSAVGGGDAVGVAVGGGWPQNGGMHGSVGVGDAVGDSVGDAVGKGCAVANAGQAAPTARKIRNAARRTSHLDN